MANCILAFPDYVQADPRFARISFSGGSWSADLPLANLLRREFAYVARSNDTALSSTQFWVDLGVDRDVRGVFIPRTNGSLNCQYRIRSFTTLTANIAEQLLAEDGTPQIAENGMPLYAEVGDAPLTDTNWSDLYPSTYPPLSLFWGSPSLWDGKMSAEDAPLYPMPVVETFDAPVIARYWLIEFDDTANTAGYFEMPRIIFSGGWQPQVNAAWGMTLAVEDQAVVQEALSGAFYYEDRPKRRVQRFTLGFLSIDDSMVWIADMQRRLGVRGEIFFVGDPADRANMHRLSFLARPRTLSPLEYTAFANNTAPLELQEIVS